MTKRPLNRCKSCGDTWYPRGRDRSHTCPKCGNSRITIVTDCEYQDDNEATDPPQPSREWKVRVVKEERHKEHIYLEHSLNNLMESMEGDFSEPEPSTPVFYFAPNVPAPPVANQSPPRKKRNIALFWISLIAVGTVTRFAVKCSDSLVSKVMTPKSPQRGEPRPPAMRPKVQKAVLNSGNAARCRALQQRLAYSRRMAQKDPVKWARWVKHWERKAKIAKCEISH